MRRLCISIYVVQILACPSAKASCSVLSAYCSGTPSPFSIPKWPTISAPTRCERHPAVAGDTPPRRVHQRGGRESVAPALAASPACRALALCCLAGAAVSKKVHRRPRLFWMARPV
eukprot:gene8116-biopygen1560